MSNQKVPIGTFLKMLSIENGVTKMFRVILGAITEKDLRKFEMVRQSGRTNMFDLKKVCQLSGLKREKVLTIIENYDALIKKFPVIGGSHE